MATRFDDIEGLRARINETFGPFGPKRAITQEMVRGISSFGNAATRRATLERRRGGF